MFKRNIKILIIGSIILVFILGIYLVYFSVLQIPTIKTNLSPTLPLIIGGGNANTEKESQIEVKPLSENSNPSQPPLIRGGENAQKIQVTLNVSDKTYATNIKKSATVYDVMRKIEEESNNSASVFSFGYKEHLGLGIFITEINGVKGTSGKYWIYYVNNVEASVGVSNYILKDGDSILWKQE